MRYITQINASPLTIVYASEPLEAHQSIVDNPDLFEIIELDELPIDTQYLHYEKQD